MSRPLGLAKAQVQGYQRTAPGTGRPVQVRPYSREGQPAAPDQGPVAKAQAAMQAALGHFAAVKAGKAAPDPNVLLNSRLAYKAVPDSDPAKAQLAELGKQVVAAGMQAGLTYVGGGKVSVAKPKPKPTPHGEQDPEAEPHKKPKHPFIGKVKPPVGKPKGAIPPQSQGGTPPGEKPGQEGAGKVATPPAQAKPGAPVPGFDHAALTDQLAKWAGADAGALTAALRSPAAPGDKGAAELRARAEAALLEHDAALQDAVLHVLDRHDAAAVAAHVGAIAKGDVKRAQAEYAQTPLYDLQCLGGVRVETGPVHGQANCNLASRVLTMGSTSVTGDFRHELGHAVRSALGGASPSGKTAMTKVVADHYAEVQKRAKADPAGAKAKLSHEWYEATYGIIGRRGLDNWEEDFAEHYRGYHREVYRDRVEGGGGQHLARYRQLHPEMARLFDARYTAALLGALAGGVAKGGDRLPGGLADRRPASAFDPERLREGRRVEMEHTDDPELAEEIARDHLSEDPDYYRKLRRMESGGPARDMSRYRGDGGR